MDNVFCFNGADCRRAAQYLITIVVVLLIGYVLSILPVMSRLQFADALFAADLILFVAQSAALVLFFLFARHVMASIPNESGTLSFIRGIIEPTAILLIVVIGQSLLWKIVYPFVSASGETVYFGVVITLIVAVAFWLAFRAYQQAPHLVDGVQYLVAHFPKLKSEPCHLCKACGGKVTKDAKYCVHCGQKLEEASKCLNCGQTLIPGQRYCPHCGKGVAA